MDAGGRDVEAEIRRVMGAHLGHLAAFVSGEPDGRHLHAPRRPEGVQKIFGVAAGRDAEYTIALLTERDDLAREDIVKANVVRHGRDHRHIVRETDGWQRTAA